MTIEEVHAALEERYPHLTFELYKDNKYIPGQRIMTRIYNNIKRIRFEVMFALDSRFIKIYYCFGKIKSDYETLFFVNKFNMVSPLCFRAIINRVEEDNYLIIQYFQPVSNPYQVPNIFINSNRDLLNRTEFELLYKRVIDEGLEKVMN